MNGLEDRAVEINSYLVRLHFNFPPIAFPLSVL